MYGLPEMEVGGGGVEMLARSGRKATTAENTQGTLDGMYGDVGQAQNTSHPHHFSRRFNMYVLSVSRPFISLAAKGMFTIPLARPITCSLEREQY